MSGDIVVLCNGATSPRKKKGDAPRVLRFHYSGTANQSQRIRIAIPTFTQDLLHLPPRVLDLLEIASYVFAADRSIKRGANDQVMYDG